MYLRSSLVVPITGWGVDPTLDLFQQTILVHWVYGGFVKRKRFCERSCEYPHTVDGGNLAPPRGPKVL